MVWQSTFSQVTLYITVYSIVGWATTAALRSIAERRFVNAGFLSGPYCPVYGAGVVIILCVAERVIGNPPLVFAIAFGIVVALELLLGWAMESIFQIRWWDYVGRRFSWKGRVCLRNSLLFALLGTLAACYAHPLVDYIINLIRRDVQRIIASLLIVVLVLELIRLLSVLERLRERVERLRGYIARLMDERREWLDGADIKGSIALLRARCADGLCGDEAEALRGLDAMLVCSHGEYRMLKAFPQMQPYNLPPGALDGIRAAWERSDPGFWGRVGRLFGGLRETTATSTGELEPFASGVSFYKMVWVFSIVSVVGYVQETLFCFITQGFVESRQGVIYGPFCQVYGFGAVVMVLLLSPLAKKKDRWVFFGGALLGGLYEAFASVMQELLLGVTSWDYTWQTYSLLGGRTSLQFVLFWGILSVVLIKFIYPRLSRLIESIPKRQGVVFSWILIIGLSLDMLVSALAVARWSDRVVGIPARNAYEQFMDDNYPDDMLWEIYPNMRFSNANDEQ